MTQKSRSRHQRLAWLALVPVLLLALLIGADSFLQSGKYTVEQLVWEGDFKHVTRQQLEHAVLDKVNGNYFTVNLKDIENGVKDIRWVSEVKAHRVWPKTIKVRFREQELIARWGDDAWLNNHGEVVKLAGEDAAGAGLPLFRGPEGTQAEILKNYRQFGELLARVPMHIRELEMTPRRTWRLRVATGPMRVGFTPKQMDIYLDDEQAHQQLMRFLAVYRDKLGPERDNIEYVDLRYPNGFALKQREQESGSRVAGSEQDKSKG